MDERDILVTSRSVPSAMELLRWRAGSPAWTRSRGRVVQGRYIVTNSDYRTTATSLLGNY